MFDETTTRPCPHRSEQISPPGPFGLSSLRQRLHQRLANQEQNAFWISAAVLLAALVGLLFYLYLAVHSAQWQYIGLVIITAVLFGVGLTSLLLSRRPSGAAPSQRYQLGIWLLLIVGQFAIAVSPVFTAGLGVWYAGGIMMSTLIIGTLTLPPGKATRANLFGILAGIATLLVDGFVPTPASCPS
jgi:hypothetical protein